MLRAGGVLDLGFAALPAGLNQRFKKTLEMQAVEVPLLGGGERIVGVIHYRYS
jgi:hypothetical protein